MDGGLGEGIAVEMVREEDRGRPILMESGVYEVICMLEEKFVQQSWILKIP